MLYLSIRTENDTLFMTKTAPVYSRKKGLLPPLRPALPSSTGWALCLLRLNWPRACVVSKLTQLIHFLFFDIYNIGIKNRLDKEYAVGAIYRRNFLKLIYSRRTKGTILFALTWSVCLTESQNQNGGVTLRVAKKLKLVEISHGFFKTLGPCGAQQFWVTISSSSYRDNGT